MGRTNNYYSDEMADSVDHNCKEILNSTENSALCKWKWFTLSRYPDRASVLGLGSDWSEEIY